MHRLFAATLFFGCLLSTSIHAQDTSTWDVIQHQILGENCATCHQAGSNFARQSDLVLTPDVAFDQLVGMPPHNDAASNDGLMRVSTVGGQVGLSQSFLWEKINAPNQEHFYEDHPDYGAIMPLGGEPLTYGQLDFIREWITSGAPQTGTVADLALLENTSRYQPGDFVPPDIPEEGFQIHVGPFDIWPAEVHDREFYYFQPYETQTSTFVRGYEIKYREGSHHFILYHYDEDSQAPEANVYRDIRTSSGQSIPDQFSGNHAEWIVASQSPHVSYSFPDDVAFRLPPGSGFDFNVHSVNRTDEARSGEVYVNFETAAAEDILHLADQRNFSNYNIYLPPHQVTTLTETFTFTETRNVVQMWTHAHEKMVEFRVEYAEGDRDGELIYWTNDWEHPPVLEEPRWFLRGEKVRLIATYDNQSDEPVTYGPLSSDEMMFMFYISHPNTADITRNDVVDANDVNRLSRMIRLQPQAIDRFDLNFDGTLDHADHTRLIHDHFKTYYGDANLDGEFNSGDLVDVFAAGEYEDETVENSGWEEGDWNGDGDFTSSDLVAAFQDGGYEKGPRQAIAAVPEPTSLVMACLALGTIVSIARRHNSPLGTRRVMQWDGPRA